jgi:formylglycine-generating enzyme required for sulfatase activity
LDIEAAMNRIQRGGSYLYQERDVRSSRRFSDFPARQLSTYGLRVARTLVFDIPAR